MFGRSLYRPGNQFFVSTAFTLPGGIDIVRVTRALVNGPVRRNDLAATAWTGSPARGAAIDIDSQLLGQIFHVGTHASGALSSFTIYDV